MCKRALRLGLAIIGLTVSACAIAAPAKSAAVAASAASAPRPLIADIESFAGSSGGRVGVAAWRIDADGPRVLFNADEQFPMASTFKIAVAGAVFARIDAGQATLEQMIDVPAERYVPSDIIADRLIHPGVALSLHNLLESMLTESDNTATDVLTAFVGGPQAVTAWLNKQGVKGQRVDRDTAGLLRDFFELPAGPLAAVIQQSLARDPKLLERGALPNVQFDQDPRDTSTPRAMADLLARIASGKALRPDSTRELIAIMQRCRTGAARLKGKLPAGTVVAHKTGTIGGTVNDVGIIELPVAGGRIAIAVFVKESAAPIAQRETVIAEIARSVRDYYLFAAGQ